MKALVCGECGDIRALPCIEPVYVWTGCRCGNLEGRWIDAAAGIALFRADRRESCFVLGLNNNYLRPAIHGEHTSFTEMRAAHDRATLAPGYVFDAEKASCWAVIFEIGSTNDTSWTDKP